jgi:hypothetical protein
MPKINQTQDNNHASRPLCCLTENMTFGEKRLKWAGGGVCGQRRAALGAEMC